MPRSPQAVPEPLSDQNFRAIHEDATEIDGRLSSAESSISTIEALGLVTDVGGTDRKLKLGTVDLTWAESALSEAEEVTHGLGAEPVAVFAISLTAPEAGKVPVPNIASKNSTVFQINAETKNSHTGEITLMWLAIA